MSYLFGFQGTLSEMKKNGEDGVKGHINYICIFKRNTIELSVHVFLK